jgi:hypothetical protein
MLLEFTPQGQVVPTRIDCLPYKFGAFATYNIDPTGSIDVMKFFLVIYTVTIVVQNFMALKTWRKMLTFSALFDNFTDMMVIFLQTYCFCIKLQDSNTFNINPMELLNDDLRKSNNSLFFIADNFRNFCIMETIGLIFVATKVLDGFRVFQRVNVIVLTLTESVQLMIIFLGGLITFNIALTPLAQAIWGTYLIGYKTVGDTINSVFMIAYSKGDLQEILNINFTWSFNFIIMYYSMVIFVLHAAFHNV